MSLKTHQGLLSTVAQHYAQTKVGDGERKRGLDSQKVSQQTEEQLRLLYESLNPMAFLRQLERLRGRLWPLETVRFRLRQRYHQSEILP